MRRASYTVVFERDASDRWLARVPEVKGCHTHGRTLEQARRRIREALGLWVENAANAELAEHVRLPGDVRAAVRTSQAARATADREHARAQAATRHAARALVRDLNVGTRDAAALLGLSPQRVQQLVKR